MKKVIIDFQQLVNHLVNYNVLLSKQIGNRERVSGWLKEYNDIVPYHGEGSLIYIKYRNEMMNNMVLYYAFSDKEVILLVYYLIDKLNQTRSTLFDSLSNLLFEKLKLSLTLDNEDVNNWTFELFVKDNYLKTVQDEVYDYSFLHTSEGFTLGNFLDDIKDFNMRKINVSQFIAEQIMNLLYLERGLLQQ